jgi:hypothetical protein
VHWEVVEGPVQQVAQQGAKMFRQGLQSRSAQRLLLPSMRTMMVAASWQLLARELHRDR